MNIWDIILLFALAIVVCLSARKVYRYKKRGRLSCGGDCARCAQGCGGCER